MKTSLMKTISGACACVCAMLCSGVAWGDNIVKVDNTEYESIATAVANASAGDTITALCDLTLSTAGEFGAFVGTFDVGGHTATVPDTIANYGFSKGGVAALTIKNGTISVAKAFMAGWPKPAYEGTTLTLASGATLNVNRGSFLGHSAGTQTVNVNAGATYKSGTVYLGYGKGNNTLLVQGALDANSVLLGNGTDGNKFILRGSSASLKIGASPWYLFQNTYGGCNGEFTIDNATIDISSRTFYYCAKNENYTGNQLSVINGGTFTVSTFGHGFHGSAKEASIAARNQKVYIGAGSKISANQYRMVGFNNELVIENGTLDLKTQNAFFWGYDDATYTDFNSTGNKIVLKGTHPKICKVGATEPTGQMTIRGTELTFDLSEGAYTSAPIDGKYTEIYTANGGSIRFTGVENLQRTITEAQDIPLATGYTGGWLKVDDALITAANATLPEGCSCSKDGLTFKLHVVPAVVERVSTDGTVTTYQSIDKAIAAVEAGDIVKLDSDVTFSTRTDITAKPSFTLNLNGYDFTLTTVLTHNPIDADGKTKIVDVTNAKTVIVPANSTFTITTGGQFLFDGGGNRFTLEGTVVDNAKYGFYFGGYLAPKPGEGQRNTFIVRGSHPSFISDAEDAQVFINWTDLIFQADAAWFTEAGGTPLIQATGTKGDICATSSDSTVITVENMGEIQTAYFGTGVVNLMRARRITSDDPSISQTGCTVKRMVFGDNTKAWNVISVTINGTNSKELRDGFTAQSSADGICTITGSGTLTASVAQDLNGHGISSLILPSGTTADVRRNFCSGLSTGTYKVSNSDETAPTAANVGVTQVAKQGSTTILAVPWKGTDGNNMKLVNLFTAENGDVVDVYSGTSYTSYAFDGTNWKSASTSDTTISYDGVELTPGTALLLTRSSDTAISMVGTPPSGSEASDIATSVGTSSVGIGVNTTTSDKSVSSIANTKDGGTSVGLHLFAPTSSGTAQQYLRKDSGWKKPGTSTVTVGGKSYEVQTVVDVGSTDVIPPGTGYWIKNGTGADVEVQ